MKKILVIMVLFAATSPTAIGEIPLYRHHFFQPVISVSHQRRKQVFIRYHAPLFALYRELTAV